MVVNNLQPNDARWLQTLTLGPGWYYVGAEARTEAVPANATGASVSLDEDSINSPDLRSAAEDPAFREPLVERIHVGDAVQQRQNEA